MNSVFKEIEKACFGNSIKIDPTGFSRYMVVSRNLDRTKTAFCFSVPICNDLAKGIVDLKFYHNKSNSYYLGSSATITIADDACLKDRYGSCRISLLGKITKKTENAIFTNSPDGCTEVRPTLNGLFFKVPCSADRMPAVRITIDQLFESVRANGKYFAIMREKFIPFITVSSIGAMNNRGEVVAPCEIGFQEMNKREYALTFESKSRFGKYVAFEINMYEPKLFQDTTVESRHPKMNNAFGGTAFLGDTDAFGEQWLYSRLEFSSLPQLQNKKILKAVLHIPKLNGDDCSLTASKIATRFCSFGSKWKNKIAVTDPIAETVGSNGYYRLDITELVARVKKESYNFVIRAKDSKGKAAVISTGDSFFQPQILEVKFQ